MSTLLKNVLTIVGAMTASVVLYYFIYGDEPREFFYNIASGYYDNVIIDNSYNQGLRITETKDDLYNNTNGASYTAEG